MTCGEKEKNPGGGNEYKLLEALKHLNSDMEKMLMNLNEPTLPLRTSANCGMLTTRRR